MSKQTRAAANDVAGSGRRQAETVLYERSPVDVLHLVAAAVVALAVIALTVWAQSAITGFEEDLVRLFDILTPSVERVLVGVAQVVLYGAAVWMLGSAALMRRGRLLGYLIVAAAVAGGVCALVQLLVDRPASELVINRIAERAGLQGNDLTATWPIASITAMLAIASPFHPRAWRRIGAGLVAVVLLSRILVSYHLPTEAVYAVPLGVAVGAGLLFAFGRPDRRPTLAAVTEALRDAGLPVAEVHAAKVDARGSTPYFATLDDGQGLFVKVLGAD